MRSERQPPNGQVGTSQAIGQMAGGLGRLLADHVALAKLELAEGLRKTRLDASKFAVALSVFFVGYCFVWAGVAALLARWWGVPASLLVIGGVHAAMGLALSLRYGARLMRHKWLQGTAEELNQTVAALKEEDARAELPRGQ